MHLIYPPNIRQGNSNLTFICPLCHIKEKNLTITEGFFLSSTQKFSLAYVSIKYFCLHVHTKVSKVNKFLDLPQYSMNIASILGDDITVGVSYLEGIGLM